MDCQKEHQSDGYGAVDNHDSRNMVQNYAKQSGCKRNHNDCQQKPAPDAQLPAVEERMDQAQQQEKDG